MSEPHQKKEYKQGRQARLDRKDKSACPYRNDVTKRYLWLAGWNDRDMKMGGAR